jgi:gluconokinase
MGVSGCGKTTVGELLALRLGCRFYDGDAFHPPANIEKMTAGQPLTDADRAPWLDQLNRMLAESAHKGDSAVLACSALKQSYRDRLAQGIPDFRLVYLRGDAALILARLKARLNHYMKPGMLESQFAVLEEPKDALVVDIDARREQITERIYVGLTAPQP